MEHPSEIPRRFPLAALPTPLHRLPRLSKHLGGPEIWIKRDDLTGLAFGGNKTRKLEFLLSDAIAQGADTILTAGAAQSNHCRQTAAAAARAGLRCELVLGGAPPAAAPQGNLLLDRLLGATVQWTSMEHRISRMEERAAELRAEGGRPYVIPYGGSNGIGAAAYVAAMAETVGQLSGRAAAVTSMVVASSSGGTQAGLCLGAKLARYGGTIIGISIDKGERAPDPYEAEMARIANAAGEWLRLEERCSPDDFRVEYRFLGGGYGVVGDVERESIQLLARLEGILLDPVYTGRAMGGLLQMIRSGEIGRDESVLFWHTGGAPALFAYAEELTTS